MRISQIGAHNNAVLEVQKKIKYKMLDGTLSEKFDKDMETEVFFALSKMPRNQFIIPVLDAIMAVKQMPEYIQTLFTDYSHSTGRFHKDIIFIQPFVPFGKNATKERHHFIIDREGGISAFNYYLQPEPYRYLNEPMLSNPIERGIFIGVESYGILEKIDGLYVNKVDDVSYTSNFSTYEAKGNIHYVEESSIGIGKIQEKAVIRLVEELVQFYKIFYSCETLTNIIVNDSPLKGVLKEKFGEKVL